MNSRDADIWAELAPRSRRVGCFDARMPFLATLTLAPIYAAADLAQRFAIGPDTIVSQFYKLPGTLHALAFLGVFLAVWIVWYVILHANVQRRHRTLSLLERMTDIRAARALLNVYLALVLGVTAALTLFQALDLGVGVQALLLIFTCLYAELAYHAQAGA